MNKLLSIIIPTKNRQIYCWESLKSILHDIDDSCEIVVQDNSDNDSLKELVKSLNSSIIVYNYNSKPQSFIDNFEAALSLSSGRYFIILGDDDSTTKDILPITQWMEKENIESITSTLVVDYTWPNSNIEMFTTGHMAIPDYSGRVQEIDVSKNLNAFLKNGLLSYQGFNLPRTYHGIVKRSCIDKVKEYTGRYFGGLTPDMYSTVALSCVIKKHRIIDFPFSIAGACPASATVHATVGGHSGELQKAPHFNYRGVYEWEYMIPKYYSVETIWAETALKALKDMQYKDWEPLFNNYKFYIYSIYNNKSFIYKLSVKETLKLNSALKSNLLVHTGKLLYTLIKYSFKKVFNPDRIFENRNIQTFENIKSLDACKEKLYQNLICGHEAITEKKG